MTRKLPWPTYPAVSEQPIFTDLSGARVLIRPYRAEDAAAFLAAIEESRDHLRPWESFDALFHSVQETEDWFTWQNRLWARGETFTCGIWRRQTGRYLGGLELVPQGWELPAFRIAYWLRQSAQGHSYMREALRLIIAYLFAEMGVQRVELHIDPRNRRSVAVAQRLGFRVACREQDAESAEAVSQHEHYTLIPADFQRL